MKIQVASLWGDSSLPKAWLISGWPMKIMSASDVAARGYDAMISGRRVVVPGFRNRIFAFAADIAPRSMKTRFTNWIMARI